MYSAGLGRFIGRDPLRYVDGFSLYRPYFIPNALDPTGTAFQNFGDGDKAGNADWDINFKKNGGGLYSGGDTWIVAQYKGKKPACCDKIEYYQWVQYWIKKSDKAPGGLFYKKLGEWQDIQDPNGSGAYSPGSTGVFDSPDNKFAKGKLPDADTYNNDDNVVTIKQFKTCAACVNSIGGTFFLSCFEWRKLGDGIDVDMGPDGKVTPAPKPPGLILDPGQVMSDTGILPSGPTNSLGLWD